MPSETPPNRISSRDRLLSDIVDDGTADGGGGRLQHHFAGMQYGLEPVLAVLDNQRSTGVEVNVQVLRFTGSDSELASGNLSGRNLDAGMHL